MPSRRSNCPRLSKPRATSATDVYRPPALCAGGFFVGIVGTAGFSRHAGGLRLGCGQASRACVSRLSPGAWRLSSLVGRLSSLAASLRKPVRAVGAGWLSSTWAMKPNTIGNRDNGISKRPDERRPTRDDRRQRNQRPRRKQSHNESAGRLKPAVHGTPHRRTGPRQERAGTTARTTPPQSDYGSRHHTAGP